MTRKDSTNARRMASEALIQWATNCLEGVQMEGQPAGLLARSLVQTSLWGIDSHGIARLPHYLKRLTAGSINPRPPMKFHRTGPCTGQFDGGHGHGIVVCHRAMDEAIAMAKENGLAAIGVSNSSHCGAIGLYGRQATREGLIGFVLTHSDALVVPHGGRSKFLGTNPICIAVPSEHADSPVCLDMATSAVAWNRVLDSRREERPLSLGWVLDQEGKATADPHAAACLLPLAEYKGYGLAFLIDLLCGPLNGMPYGPHIPAMYGDYNQRRQLGSFMMAIDPGRFAGASTFVKTTAQMAEEARRQPLADRAAEILVPGDPEYRCAEERLRNGIPLDAGFWQEMCDWSERLEVKIPSPLPAAVLDSVLD